MNTAPSDRQNNGGIEHRQDGKDQSFSREQLTDGVADADRVGGRPVAVVPARRPLDRVVLGGGELGHGGHRHEGDPSLRQRRHSRAHAMEEARNCRGVG